MTTVTPIPADQLASLANANTQRLAARMAQDVFAGAFRQAMTADAKPTVGVYFGTTSGEIWGTRDEGRTWRRLGGHLPHIYAVEVG